MEDVVIIGGGVGGLATAKTLAEEGISPLLLEKNKEFGQKACGEMVAEEFCGFTIYDFLSPVRDPSLNGVKDKKVILKKFDKMIVNFWGKEYLFDLKKSTIGFKELLQIDKRAFEEHLAREAEKSGAKIVLGKGVKKIERKGERILIDNEIETKILIGADGFHSMVRKFTGQKIRNYSLAVSGYGKSETEYPYFVFDPRIVRAGYAWIFPRKENEANIGCGTLEIKKINQYLKNFLEKFNLEIKTVKGALLPTQLPLRTYFDNILLVGEAACLTDPFWGGGINSALFSGYLAAKTASEALSRNDFSANFLKKYQKEWRKKPYFSLVKNYFLQKMISNFFLHRKNTSSFLLGLLSRLD